jgi:hypothetical protein
MALVSARPAALRRYGDGVGVADVELGARAAELREVLGRYRRSAPDVGGDHTGVADRLERLSRDALDVSRHVQQIASAFERLDDLPGALAALGAPGSGSGSGSSGLRRLPTAMFERSYEEVGTAWERLEYLGEVVEDLDSKRWLQLVWGSRRRPPCLGDYAGSGAVRGPDGRLYPLVIPELEIDGHVAHISYDSEAARDPASLGGNDPGWVVIEEAVGVARVEAYEPGWGARAGVVAGILAGYSPVQQRWASPEQLATVIFGPTGEPMLGHGDVSRRLPHDPRVTHQTAPGQFDHVRRGRGLGAVNTLATAGQAYLLASELEYPGINAYRVLFEQHEDGSRRARMHTYQWVTTPAGSTPVPYMGFTVGGELRRKMVTPAPKREYTMSQRGGPAHGRGGSSVGPRRSARPAAR